MTSAPRARSSRASSAASTGSAPEEVRLHDALAAAASEHERVLALDAELRALLVERSALEEEWLGLAEQLEGSVP